MDLSGSPSRIEEPSQSCHSPFVIYDFEEDDDAPSPLRALQRSGTLPPQDSHNTPRTPRGEIGHRRSTEAVQNWRGSSTNAIFARATMCGDPSHNHTVLPSEERFNTYFCQSQIELQSPYKRPYSTSRSRGGNNFLRADQKYNHYNYNDDKSNFITNISGGGKRSLGEHHHMDNDGAGRCAPNNNPTNNGQQYSYRYMSRYISPLRHASTSAAYSTEQPTSRDTPFFHAYSNHIFKSPTRQAVLNNPEYDLSAMYSSPLFPIDPTLSEWDRGQEGSRADISHVVSRRLRASSIIPLERAPREKHVPLPVRSSYHDTRQRLRRLQRDAHTAPGHERNGSPAAARHLSGLNTTASDHYPGDGSSINLQSKLLRTLVKKRAMGQTSNNLYQDQSKGNWAANSKRYRELRVENAALYSKRNNEHI